MKLRTQPPVGRPARARLTRVRVKLCSNHCRLCIGEHRYTEPMDAERLDGNRVLITQPDDLWRGAVVRRSDYEFAEDA